MKKKLRSTENNVQITFLFDRGIILIILLLFNLWGNSLKVIATEYYEGRYSAYQISFDNLNEIQGISFKYQFENVSFVIGLLSNNIDLIQPTNNKTLPQK